MTRLSRVLLGGVTGNPENNFPIADQADGEAMRAEPWS